MAPKVYKYDKKLYNNLCENKETDIMKERILKGNND